MNRAVSLIVLVGAAVIASVATAQVRGDGGPVEIVQKFVRANEAADLDAIVDTFDDTATMFDPAQPVRSNGRPAIRESFARIFKQRRGPITISLTDVEVQTVGEVAVVTAHLRPPSPPPVATATSFGRRTFVLRRSLSEWRIVHMHASNLALTPPQP